MEMEGKMGFEEMSTLFSIVIPMYNVQEYIVECLDSIVAQDSSDVEIICVDDGSTDDTLAITQKWKEEHPAVRMIVLQQTNQRQAAARNYAFKYASGEYIIMLDSDDVLFPDYLSIVRQDVNKYHSDIVACSVVNWYPNSDVPFVENAAYSHPEFCMFDSGKAFLDYFVKLKHWGPTGMFYIFKRSMLERYGLKFTEGIYHEDDIFIAQLCYFAQSVVVDPELKYCYRMRSESTMHRQNINNTLDKFTAAYTLEQFFQQQKYINPISRSIVYNVAANGLFGMKYLNRRDLITKDRWSLVWRNASWKRKIKLIWRMGTILLKR